MQEEMSVQSLLGPLEELSQEDLRTRQHELTNLSNSQGWDLYRSVIRAQIEGRKNSVYFAPCKTMDDTLPQEFMKGEGSGMYQTMTLLELLIEALDEEITARKFEEDKEDA